MTWQKEDDIIDCKWKEVKPIKPHHVFNAIVAVIAALYLFGIGMAYLIITLLGG